jgi:hypothetical protein
MNPSGFSEKALQTKLPGKRKNRSGRVYEVSQHRFLSVDFEHTSVDSILIFKGCYSQWLCGSRDLLGGILVGS